MTTRDSIDRETREMADLRRENDYLRRLVEQTTSRLLTADTQAIAVRHELEQKRRGFRLMAELAVTLGQDADFESVFTAVSRRVNATLNMQRTAILFPEENNVFHSAVLQGYPAEERERIEAKPVAVDPAFLDPVRPVLITGADPVTRFGALREFLGLPYLISAPVMLSNDVAALLITGRTLEQRPYLPRLGASDVETVQTVGAYLAAILAGHRLRQAESLAKHDPLTHLPNLRGTSEQLRQTLMLARRGGFFVAIMFVDLDGFKGINDNFGHAAGDMILRRTAERLARCVRGSDFVGRIGGDEFLVVLSHVRRPDDAGLVARNIIRALSRPVDECGGCKIGASIGIAIFPDHGSDETSLINAADEAMYKVKNMGKNSYAFASR